MFVEFWEPPYYLPKGASPQNRGWGCGGLMTPHCILVVVGTNLDFCSRSCRSAVVLWGNGLNYHVDLKSECEETHTRSFLLFRCPIIPLGKMCHSGCCWVFTRCTNGAVALECWLEMSSLRLITRLANNIVSLFEIPNCGCFLLCGSHGFRWDTNAFWHQCYFWNQVKEWFDVVTVHAEHMLYSLRNELLQHLQGFG